MIFSDDAIDNLVAIWEREFGVRLSADEANAEANRLMDLCWLLAQALPSKNDTPPTTP
jgi:hypothetical protein